MPLTHVCVWDNNGWKRITISEAVKKYPRGSISAKTGLFMCELCGQYVSMTQPGLRDSYFKHSKEQDDKNCPERSFGIGGWESKYNTLKLESKGMPLKLEMMNDGKINFKVGLYSLPKYLYDSDNTVSIIDSYNNKKVYSFERLDRYGITYLNLGSNISEYYHLKVKKHADEIMKYWQLSFKGVDEGCLFEKNSGRKLASDSDVKINEIYYAITRKNYIYKPNSIKVQRIGTKGFWNIYEIKAIEFDESSAKFFLEYFHCRLTDSPISMTFVWPICIQTPYYLYHKDDLIFTYVQGNGNIRLFPIGGRNSLELDNGTLVSVDIKDSNQMLAVGRTVNILDYVYFVKDDLDYKKDAGEYSVTDFNGNAILSGILNDEPERNYACIKSQYDGSFEILKDNWPVYKIQIQSGESLTIDKMRAGFTYRLYQGLDVIWELTINKINKSIYEINEDMLLEKLKSCKGKRVTISHSYGNVVRKIKGYSKIKQWILSQVKKGNISRDAKQIIEKLAK